MVGETRNDPGTRLGRGRRQIVAFAVTSWRQRSLAVRLFHQLRAVFALLTVSAPSSAPSRIQTYAHGSGGRPCQLANLCADLPGRSIPGSHT